VFFEKRLLDLLDKETGGLLIAGIEATPLETDVPPHAEMETLKQLVVTPL
jgi:hypothetical protein